MVFVLTSLIRGEMEAQPLDLVCGHLERPARGCGLPECRRSECQTLLVAPRARSGPLGHPQMSLLIFKVFGDSRPGCLTGFLADPWGEGGYILNWP